jgi:hypothetical protein
MSTIRRDEGRLTMRMHPLTPAMCLILFAACSSSAPGGNGSGGDDGGTGGGEASSGSTVTEHGLVYDYGTFLTSGTLVAVPGLTVTDGDQTATTDANGKWSITLPLSATMQPVVTGTSKGDPYSNLMLPMATAAASDLDWGNIIFPDVSTFQLERVTLGSDDSQAVVHVVTDLAGACTSVAGGVLAVTSPPGAKVNYFDSTGYPSATATSMVDPPVPGRPVADIYDLTPGADITLTVTHPTCHLAPYPVTVTGASLTGQVTTKAAEPGDNNSAMNIVLE